MNKKVLGIIFLLLAQFALLLDGKKVNFVVSKLFNQNVASNRNKNWNQPYSTNNKRKLRAISCHQTAYYFSGEYRPYPHDDPENPTRMSLINFEVEDNKSKHGFRVQYLDTITFDNKTGQIHTFDPFREAYILIPVFSLRNEWNTPVNDKLEFLIVNGKLKYKFNQNAGSYWYGTINLITLEGIHGSSMAPDAYKIPDKKRKIKCRWENPFAPETIDQYNYTNKSWGF